MTAGGADRGTSHPGADAQDTKKGSCLHMFLTISFHNTRASQCALEQWRCSKLQLPVAGRLVEITQAGRAIASEALGMACGMFAKDAV